VNQGDFQKVEGWIQHLRTLGVNAKHIHSNNHGKSLGLNLGLKQVSTPFVAITDDDCFVDRDWLKKITEQLELYPDAVITGRVEAAGQEVNIVVTSTTPSVQRKPRMKFDSMSGGNLGISMIIFKKVGLFDEDQSIKNAEDAEWAYRVLRNNVPIVYDPGICIWHFGWRDPNRREEQYRNYALSHGGFYGKYLKKGDIFILIRALFHFLRSVRRWIYGVWSKNPDLALIGKAYTIYLLPGIIGGLRSKVKPGRLD
jgi:GT2 family glycosyltransferase